MSEPVFIEVNGSLINVSAIRQVTPGIPDESGLFRTWILIAGDDYPTDFDVSIDVVKRMIRRAGLMIVERESNVESIRRQRVADMANSYPSGMSDEPLPARPLGVRDA